ncbi:succinylglutamate desuccinylase/aspartoacylase family protein [Bradyrhizobium sp. AUGA SZCCT0222]|uniref:succinylglutamate desuccinylase/aspartoacylase family protein n=1 Tax=Bradyrhizobium sp. AUGA SZCCT0222 TaxID=2807668 RepID=UPI001BABEEC1|nr:succinylglutamate desuccinylase/aspartoacylase family protein [Bradyrhizobium sp. AUGA SZCCT0222]MBR1268284.1 succinylglutamate desuccinylase/aspartoacylase family protein [Bradyrhizobium sp. AUGA SZCCT0222]
MHTGLFHEIDFDADHKWSGHLSIPFSIDRSPYFQVKIPIFRIRNGAGPRVLLMAGNHGDEYEGEITLARLFRRLDPANMKGEVTILPFANLPAVMAARRRSPLDEGNLNRAFPGDSSGTPTFRLAHFLEHELFPRHDVIFDIHSGGTSMAHLPCALIERQGPPDMFARALGLMEGLGMPFAFVAENGAEAPTSMAAAARARAIGISGEFGSGGTVTPQTMALTARAVDRLLLALGIIEAHVLGPHVPIEGQTELLALESHAQAVFATRRGWFEPAVVVGARVRDGDVAGWYHDFERPEAPEEVLHFPAAGIVISQRLHTDCQSGDCLVQVGRPLTRDEVSGR